MMEEVEPFLFYLRNTDLYDDSIRQEHCAAIPSDLPIYPIISVVVALILICDLSHPQSDEIFSTILGINFDSFGSWQMIVASIFTILNFFRKINQIYD